MTIFPCSNDLKYSSWDLLAGGSVGFGLTALFFTRAYRAQWYSQYAPHLVAAVLITSAGSLLCKGIINHDPDAGIEKSNKEKLEQWKQIHLETEGQGKKQFLERCTIAQLAHILIAEPNDFWIIKDEICSEHMTDALDKIVVSNQLALFWFPLRLAPTVFPNEMCQSVFKLMSPQSAAKLLDLAPHDVEQLIALRPDPLKVVQHLTTSEAMHRWIQRKQTKNLLAQQIEELYEAMRPPLPKEQSANYWETWHPQPTEAFKRFISEYQQFNAMVVIKDSKTLLVFMKILGRDFSMEYLTHFQVIEKIINPQAIPISKITQKKGIQDVDVDDVRIRGIHAFFQNFQFQDELAAHAYLQMAKNYWPRATLLALDDISKIAVATSKERVLQKIIKSIYRTFKSEVNQTPDTLMQIMFANKVPPSHLQGLARTLTRLGINFEGLPLLLESIFNQLLETNNKDLTLVLENFVFLLPEQHRRSLTVELQKDAQSVGNWCRSFEEKGFGFHVLDRYQVQAFLNMRFSTRNASISSLILKYFENRDDLESFYINLLEKKITTKESAEQTLYKYLKCYIIDKGIEKLSFEKVLNYAATSKTIKKFQLKRLESVVFGEWSN